MRWWATGEASTGIETAWTEHGRLRADGADVHQHPWTEAPPVERLDVVAKRVLVAGPAGEVAEGALVEGLAGKLLVVADVDRAVRRFHRASSLTAAGTGYRAGISDLPTYPSEAAEREAAAAPEVRSDYSSWVVERPPTLSTHARRRAVSIVIVVVARRRAVRRPRTSTPGLRSASLTCSRSFFRSSLHGHARPRARSDARKEMAGHRGAGGLGRRIDRLTPARSAGKRSSPSWRSSSCRFSWIIFGRSGIRRTGAGRQGRGQRRCQGLTSAATCPVRDSIRLMRRSLARSRRRTCRSGRRRPSPAAAALGRAASGSRRERRGRRGRAWRPRRRSSRRASCRRRRGGEAAATVVTIRARRRCAG